MCKVNGLNHKALDARTPCVCIRKALFMETNVPMLCAEMPKKRCRKTLFCYAERCFRNDGKAFSAR